MKKPKISLGSGGIKGLILKHVEKAVVALAVLFFVFLVLKASKLGGDFDLQPDQLQTASVEADKAIRAPKTGPSMEVPLWGRIADGIKTEVPAGPYVIPYPWMHQLFPGETLRGQPQVFPVEKLRAATGFGGISISASGVWGGADTGMAGGTDLGMEGAEGGMGGYGAGGKAEGHRWVVVTGLLPYKKQFLEYGNVFRNAEVKDPRRDVPSYSYYDVQRAEVTPGVDPKEEDWQPLKVFSDMMERRKKWAGSQPEIVYGKFLHRTTGVIPMAYPLPPLVGKSFGPEIAHEPEIPLYYVPEQKEQREEVNLEELENDPEKLIQARTLMGRVGGAGQYGEPEMYGESYESPEQDYGGYGMESEYGMEAGYGPGGGGYGGMAGAMGPRREIPEYQLFRFMDFTVSQGKYYQYRVRLRLANPNYQMPAQGMESEELTKAPFLETDWSMETKMISVPLDSRVLAGPVNVSSNVNVVPRGEAVTVFFKEADGTEVAEKHAAVYRGQLMNFYQVPVKEEKPAPSLYGAGEYGAEMEGDIYGAGAPEPPKAKKRQPKEEVEMIDYVTEMLVLDFQGGSPLPGIDRLKAPGRTLLMDPAGNLILKDELENQEEWIEFFPPEEKKKPEQPGDIYGEEMYMTAP